MTSTGPVATSGSSAGRATAIALAPVLGRRARDADLARIREAAPGARLVTVSREGTPDGSLDDVDVLLTGWLPAGVLEHLVGRCPRLGWVHSASAGVEDVLGTAIVRRGIAVTNGRGVFTRPIAEHALLMILAASRRLPQLLELQRERTWQPIQGTELRDMTVGVVGLGSIGRAVAALAAACGCRVLAVRRHAGRGSAETDVYEPDPDLPPLTLQPDDVLPPERLGELLARSDVVVLALPLTPATDTIIDEAAIEQMKPGAWLINVSRGRLVDERALLRALREGRVGGAALDAFRHEPLAPESAFYELPNVIVTPHTSWSSGRVLDRSIDLFCENLRRYRAGTPLLNRVDLAAGY